MHRLLTDAPIPDPGQIMAIDGDEAAHAIRVKRLEPGEAVVVMDGAGVIAEGVVHEAARGRSGPTLSVRISTRREVAAPGLWPIVDVFAATPKGGRVDEMIDGLSQVGAASWSPLNTARGIVDPREAKLSRLERIAREAAKQCGRAWVLRIDRAMELADVLRAGDARIIVADESGEPFAPSSINDQRPIHLLIGPEGGWAQGELAAARSAGAQITRFGLLTMRIETAAIAATAIIMASQPTSRSSV